MGFGVQDQAEFAGRIAYRALVNADDANVQWTKNIVLRLGRDAHLVQYPLRGGSLINLVATVGSATQTRGEDERTSGSTLEDAFSGWSREARLLTKAPAEWRAWPLYHRSPISSFSLGRVALVGDAAHPMLPFLAQGAAQAIEDAGALGRILAQVQDIPAALSMYCAIVSREPVEFNGKRSNLAASIIWVVHGRSLGMLQCVTRDTGPNRAVRLALWRVRPGQIAYKSHWTPSTSGCKLNDECEESG